MVGHVFLEWITTVAHCSWLFVEQDDVLYRIRSEPCDDCLGIQGDDVLGPWDFSEMAEQQSPRQQKDHRARKHSCFLSLSRTANRRWGLKEGEGGKKRKGKRPEEGEKGGKMRAFPPISELFPCTGLSVGGLADYSVLFGFTIASQFSPNSLIAAELWDMTTLASMQTQLENHFSPPTMESFILFRVNDTPHYTAFRHELCAAAWTTLSLWFPVMQNSSPSLIFYFSVFLGNWFSVDIFGSWFLFLLVQKISRAMGNDILLYLPGKNGE